MDEDYATVDYEFTVRDARRAITELSAADLAGVRQRLRDDEGFFLQQATPFAKELPLGRLGFDVDIGKQPTCPRFADLER